jgi:hypothetical protein
MARRALLREDFPAPADGAAAGRQVFTVAADIDIPAGDFGVRRRSPDAVMSLRFGTPRVTRPSSAQEQPMRL